MSEPVRFMVTPLSSAQAEQAAEVSARCFARPWSAADLLRSAEDPVRRALVATVAGAVVGVGVASIVAGEAEVLTLGVDPALRRRGIGRALLAALVEGASRAHLEVRASDEGARALYAGAGFVPTARRPAYYADGEDAVVMALDCPTSP